jgi:hypothetical protein
MLFRNVHYSEWPKLRPAHLFFLGSALEQLTHSSTRSPRNTIRPPNLASCALLLRP